MVGGALACVAGILMSAPDAAAAGSTSDLVIWANDGGDKVLRDELRADADPSAVLNSAWDGTGVSVFGARNEVVAFNLVLEAPGSDVSGVDVELAELAGPSGYSITTRAASGEEVFDYRGRNIELFFVRYLAVEGLSILAYETYDERHIPEGCRRPYRLEIDGGRRVSIPVAGTGWEDRPCHDRLYPEIAVPLELEQGFTVPEGANQSIWVDVTIPGDAPSGTYTGTIRVTADSGTPVEIPVTLRVRDFELPDEPSSRTMLVVGDEDVYERYLGERWIEPSDPEYGEAIEILDRHFQLAHRHRISLIDATLDLDVMEDAWVDRLSGALFEAGRGYDGPGIGVGNNVFSVGTYGQWSWQDGGRAEMWENTDAWVEWFDAQDFETPVEYFLYLIDESDEYSQIEQWARWMDENPGPGARMPSMATMDLPTALNRTPSLDIPTSQLDVGASRVWRNAMAEAAADPDMSVFFYNGIRPATGSFATDDEGVALRMIPWVQYEMGIDRWFYWESTYYLNFQCYGYWDPRAQTNVFAQAQTYGCDSRGSPVLGRTGWNYMNGDGVLFYPGTDLVYPEESYGVPGPFASLRLKHWRRGIQDAEYLALAMEVSPIATRAILDRMIPSVLWENGVSDPRDPTYVFTDISWSIDPDDWEAARAQLADLIEGGCTISGTSSPDVLTGTEGPDVICGWGGADEIDGLGGNDVILGGAGDDVIDAGDGHDVVFAGPGADTVDGGEGDDRLRGQAGPDVIEGGPGDDSLLGGGAGDDLAGNEGDDDLVGGGGSDTCDGGPGLDLVRGC
jgi:hypothetical protein